MYIMNCISAWRHFHKIILATLLFTSSLALGQEELRQLVNENWIETAVEEKVATLRTGLSEPENDQSKMYALAGISQLAVDDLETARSHFPATDIYPYLFEKEPNVVEMAAYAYMAILQDDVAAETAIVAAAINSDGSVRLNDYIYFLGHQGLSSDAAVNWLFTLVQQPVSDVKFSAVSTLLIGLDTPPRWLLAHVIGLIKSNEYFSHHNLLVHLPDFGSEATVFIPELYSLRETLAREMDMPVDDRSFTLYMEPEGALTSLNRAIESLEQLEQQ